MGGTKIERHALPAHDRVEESDIGNLNYVTHLISALEAQLARVEVMYLERFEMIAR